MIKAKEAKAISQSSELDQQILDKISITIIKEASQGNYCADITSIISNLPYTYIEYLKEFGYSIKNLYNGIPGIYIVWY